MVLAPRASVVVAHVPTHTGDDLALGLTDMAHDQGQGHTIAARGLAQGPGLTTETGQGLARTIADPAQDHETETEEGRLITIAGALVLRAAIVDTTTSVTCIVTQDKEALTTDLVSRDTRTLEVASFPVEGLFQEVVDLSFREAEVEVAPGSSTMVDLVVDTALIVLITTNVTVTVGRGHVTARTGGVMMKTGRESVTLTGTETGKENEQGEMMITRVKTEDHPRETGIT